MSYIQSLINSGKAFKEAWTTLRSPSPFGNQIYSSSLIERLSFVWKGYHVTQKNRMEMQLIERRFENKNQKIYWCPLLLEKGDKSVLLFGGKEKGCWTADDPIILRIASNRLWRWDSTYHFPFFPYGSQQDVKILDAWEVNPKWIQDRRTRKPWLSFAETLKASIAAAKNAFHQANQ